MIKTLAYTIVRIVGENAIFRYAILKYVPGFGGVALSTMTYAFAHYIEFNWKMVLLCVPLGYVLASAWLMFDEPWNWLVCLGIQGVAGFLAWLMQLDIKWKR